MIILSSTLRLLLYKCQTASDSFPLSRPNNNKRCLGHMRDENKPEDLEKAAEVFNVLAERIKIIVDANS